MPSNINLPVHKVVTNIVADDEMFIPKYQHEDDACCDLVANIPEQGDGTRTIRLNHRNTVVIDCGFSMLLKKGWRADISARSGWATKGLIVTNGPGRIDRGYIGRVGCIVTNVGNVNPIAITHGDRIAQMCVEPVYQFFFNPVTELEATERGTGGFGSTGV
jgi:dUTP pyrophosphatase